MRKLLLLGLVSGWLIACDSPDRASQSGAAEETEENATASPDGDASIHTDTTTSGGMNRQNPYDTLQ